MGQKGQGKEPREAAAQRGGRTRSWETELLNMQTFHWPMVSGSEGAGAAGVSCTQSPSRPTLGGPRRSALPGSPPEDQSCPRRICNFFFFGIVLSCLSDVPWTHAVMVGLVPKGPQLELEARVPFAPTPPLLAVPSPLACARALPR